MKRSSLFSLPKEIHLDYRDLGHDSRGLETDYAIIAELRSYIKKDWAKEIEILHLNFGYSIGFLLLAVASCVGSFVNLKVLKIGIGSVKPCSVLLERLSQYCPKLELVDIYYSLDESAGVPALPDGLSFSFQLESVIELIVSCPHLMSFSALKGGVNKQIYRHHLNEDFLSHFRQAFSRLAEPRKPMTRRRQRELDEESGVLHQPPWPLEASYVQGILEVAFAGNPLGLGFSSPLRRASFSSLSPASSPSLSPASSSSLRPASLCAGTNPTEKMKAEILNFAHNFEITKEGIDSLIKKSGLSKLLLFQLELKDRFRLHAYESGSKERDSVVQFILGQLRKPVPLGAVLNILKQTKAKGTEQADVSGPLSTLQDSLLALLDEVIHTTEEFDMHPIQIKLRQDLVAYMQGTSAAEKKIIAKSALDKLSKPKDLEALKYTVQQAKKAVRRDAQAFNRSEGALGRLVAVALESVESELSPSLAKIGLPSPRFCR